MTEWAALLLVFWLLWAIEGWRIPPTERFGVVGGRRGFRLIYSRLLPPSWLPTSWSTVAADIPFSLSVAGIANRPAATAGRPTDGPVRAVAWPWADVKDVVVKSGWIEINGLRFCRDTGHFNASQLLALARWPEAERADRIRWWMRRWWRPAHVRRRVRVLRGRTSFVASTNGTFLALSGLITAYLMVSAVHPFPPHWTEWAGRVLLPLIAYLFLLHVVAMIAAWRAIRRLKAVRPDKRGSSLFTALMLPPQALRLRALLGDGFFPAQHPLAWVLAFGRPELRREIAFDVLADLRWPVHDDNDSPLAREVARGWRDEWQRLLLPAFREVGLEEADLLAAPLADGPTSERYCPRCQCQFRAQREKCPHGVTLLPVRKSGES